MCSDRSSGKRAERAKRMTRTAQSATRTLAREPMRKYRRSRVTKIFGADKALGGNKKSQGRIAASSDYDGQNEAFEVSDQAAPVEFDDIDEFRAGLAG